MNKPARILCIDYGRKFTGVAVADFPGITARSLDTIRPDRTDLIAELSRIIREEKVTGILLGFPFSDVEGEIHRQIHEFKSMLIGKFPQIPVEYVDESYSSLEAEELIRETGIGRRKKARAQDSEAAKLVLLRYLQNFS